MWGFVRKDAPAILQKLADEEGLKVAGIRLRDHGLLKIKDINRLLREGSAGAGGRPPVRRRKPGRTPRICVPSRGISPICAPAASA